MPSHQAAWIDGKGEKLRIGSTETKQPGSGQLLIKNYALAINPIDYIQQDSGMFVQNWPTILGTDVAGEVVAVGEGVTRFSKGQRVLAHALPVVSGKVEESAFQEYTLVVEQAATPIPDDLAYEAAAVIPSVLSTAAHGLYGSDYLNLPLPSTNPKKLNKTIIIWGGSSSVGSSVVQAAVASGLDIVSTASPKNFDYVKRLGAKQVLDYNSATIVDDLISAVGNSELAGAYDAITKPETVTALAKVVEKFGGGFIACTLPPPDDLPENVSAKMVFAAKYALDEGSKIFKDFLPAALKEGKYKAAPEPEVIGKGLENVQDGIDRIRKGVSAKKLIVTL